MRGTQWLLGLALLVSALTGCDTTRQQIKPPPGPEEYKLPPEADARYSEPPRFPKGTLNQNQIARPTVDPQMQQNQPGIPGPSGPSSGFGSPMQPASYR